MAEALPSDVVARFPGLAALDLEVCPRSSAIRAIGALRTDREAHFRWRGDDPAEGGRRLGEYLGGAGLVVGHNLANFDLAHLEAAGGAVTQLWHADTLWLAALAWPEPRTLRLIKTTRAGPLGAADANDPVADAAAALDLFGRALAVLSKTLRLQRDLAEALHGVSCAHPALGRGAVLSVLRGRAPPDRLSCAVAIHRLAQGRICTAQTSVLAQLCEMATQRCHSC